MQNVLRCLSISPFWASIKTHTSTVQCWSIYQSVRFFLCVCKTKKKSCKLLKMLQKRRAKTFLLCLCPDMNATIWLWPFANKKQRKKVNENIIIQRSEEKLLRISSLFDRYYYYEQCMLINLTLVMFHSCTLFAVWRRCLMRLHTQHSPFVWNCKLFYEFVSGKKINISLCSEINYGRCFVLWPLVCSSSLLRFSTHTECFMSSNVWYCLCANAD